MLLVVFTIFTSQLVHAKEPQALADDFFKLIRSGKIAEAYDQLLQGSQIPAQKPQAVEVLKKQTETALPIFGNIVGVEKIREEKIGTSIVRLVYVLKSEIAPTVWELYFYKPKADWFLGNIMFNDQFQLLHTIQ